MNILFLTMNNFEDIQEHSVYPDLIRCLAKKGHHVTVLLPREKKSNEPTKCEKAENIFVIKVRTGNLFNVSMFTKLVSRSQICRQYESALKEFCHDEKYDLILSSTPPTVLYSLINKIKQRDRAYSYLMLKDIFPQNAVDLGMIKDGGIMHRFLRLFEKKLYMSSDKIGCMSPANVHYLMEQDSWIAKNKITVCPNALEVRPLKKVNKDEIRKKYDIPADKIVIVYGGGIGIPQGIDFFVDCIKKIGHSDKYIFVVMGSGSYVEKLELLSREYGDILKVIPWLPVDDFNDVVASGDIGLILLDYRFRIPNFPSRLLAYLQAGIPVLSATDENCDVGTIAEENGFGYWCVSKEPQDFVELLSRFDGKKEREEMGNRARLYFEKYYNAEIVADNIISEMSLRYKNDI